MEEYPEFYYPDAVSVFNNEISERYLTILEYTEGDVLTFSGLQMYLCLKKYLVRTQKYLLCPWSPLRSLSLHCLLFISV